MIIVSFNFEELLMYQYNDSDTICAISTAPGCGGIAVIRVSGPDAISIINKIGAENLSHQSAHIPPTGHNNRP